jgi:hypothetical protein
MPPGPTNVYLAVLERSKKRIVIALGVAVLIHLPLTPAMPVLRLLHRVAMVQKADKKPLPTEPVPARNVEVELREVVRQEEKKQEESSEPGASSKAPQLAMVGPTPNAVAKSAVTFAPGGEDPKADAKAAEAAEAKAAEAKAAEALAKAQKQRELERLKAIGLTGKLDPALTGKPNVSIGIWFSTMRDHVLGESLSRLVGCDGQWRSVLAQGLSPMRDLEGVLVVGARLEEPDKMTAVVRHNLSEQRMRDVMNALVVQSGPAGKWIRPDTAAVRLGAARRVMFPQANHFETFFVAPGKGWEVLRDSKEPLSIPQASSRGLSVAIRQPSGSLSRYGLSLPASIEELRLEVYPNPDQSIDVKVELEEKTEAKARESAATVSAQVGEFFGDLWTATMALSLVAGPSGDAPSSAAEPAPRLQLAAREKMLVGMVHLTPGQSRTTLALFSSLFCRKGKKGEATQKPPAPAPSSAGPPRAPAEPEPSAVTPLPPAEPASVP